MMNTLSALLVVLALVPGPQQTTAAGATCGDHLLDAGETCEACPDDCSAAACTVPKGAKPVRFAVEWAPPTGQSASSLTLLVGYRSDRVGLPGTGATPQVRLEKAPANAIVLLNDLDYAVRVVLTKSGTIEPGQVFTLAFDRCESAPAPTASDFSCRVAGCATAAGDLQGCSCRVRTD